MAVLHQHLSGHTRAIRAAAPITFLEQVSDADRHTRAIRVRQGVEVGEKEWKGETGGGGSVAGSG